MKRIREIETKIAEKYSEQKMRCPVHLSIGQELVPAICQELMLKKDYVVSSHRCHAHFLAKKGNLKSMIAEIYGKKTGCSEGKGGSMHLIDLSVNFMGSSAIVGNSIPTAVGLGLSAKLKKNNQVSIAFFGEGAIEEGVFYESINFAAVKKLPVVFICENNLYSVYSPLEVRQPKGRNNANMVSKMGVASFQCMNQDILDYYKAIKMALEKARKNKEPVFLELFTYRWREHCGPNFDNDIGYRSEEEFNKHKSKDPLENLENLLIPKNLKEINFFKKNINKEINEAFNFAEKSPFPDKKEAFEKIYAKRK